MIGLPPSFSRKKRSSNRFYEEWFRLGDVVTIDPEGRMQIVGRTKDLVRSGKFDKKVLCDQFEDYKLPAT